MSKQLVGMGEADRAHLALECLDVGVLLVDVTTRAVVHRNAAAIETLEGFEAAPDGQVPEAVWSRIETALEEARLVPGRFTAAISVMATDRRRFFVRCRIAGPSLVVLTIAPAMLREKDLRRVLSEQFGLNSQEARVAFLAAQGYRNKEIADLLDIVEGTVKNYLTQIFSALSVRSRTELASELGQLLEEQTDIHRRRG